MKGWVVITKKRLTYSAELKADIATKDFLKIIAEYNIERDLLAQVIYDANANINGRANR